MSKLQARIEEAAKRFAETVVETIRGLTIDELGGTLGTVRSAPPRPAATARGPRESGPRVQSAKQRAARKVQGTYIGLLRKFGPKDKLAFKRIAKGDSVKAAVTAMKKKLGRV